MVYTVVLDCCILLVVGLCFCLEYLEGGCLTGQSMFMSVFFEYIADVSLISVCRAQLHTILNLDSPQICSWPRFLLVKGTNDERPLCRLSTFAVNKAIVAILGSDPFNIKN